MKKFLRSLLVKYMLIILTAIVLLQLTLLVGAVLIFNLVDDGEEKEYMTATFIEEKWHEEAGNLSAESIPAYFQEWKETYPEASMFWVDGTGTLRDELDVQEEIPKHWDAVMTADFLKSRYDSDPFTVVAFVGKEKTDGFIVFEMPRDDLYSSSVMLYDTPFVIAMAGVVALFVLLSFLFFRSIRKRLLFLQEAMEVRDVDGLPVPIEVKKEDEIGSLEHTFNRMINELKDSKQREQEEEQLRRELIANLSHDLRTPLTKIQAYTYSIAKESQLSKEGNQAVASMDKSVKSVDRLIENLMSYTLLMASKLNYEAKPTDIVRFVKMSVASWYPILEKEGIEIDVNLKSFQLEDWHVDPLWMGRILDNLFQNVIRHAKSGRYIGISTESNESYDAIVIADRGPGMKTESDEKGAGIGLSIVDRMVKEMQLDWEIDTSEAGTVIKIKKVKTV